MYKKNLQLIMFAALIFLIPTANVYGKEIIETGISINNGENDAVVTENILNISSSYLGFQGYNDVSVTDWFYHSVVLVTDRLIMNGSYGYFYPNNRLTRAEAVTILGRVYGDNVVFNETLSSEFKKFLSEYEEELLSEKVPGYKMEEAIR